MSSASKSSASRPLKKTDYESLAAFRHALRQFLQFSEKAAATEGLAAQQHQALLVIKGFPGREQVTISELAEKLLIQHHSAVGLVNRLETEGLIKRGQDITDGRKVILSLSSHGEELLSRLTSTHRDELRRIGPIFRQLLDEIGALS